MDLDLSSAVRRGQESESSLPYERLPKRENEAAGLRLRAAVRRVVVVRQTHTLVVRRLRVVQDGSGRAHPPGRA
jgi:hypothetical protein